MDNSDDFSELIGIEEDFNPIEIDKYSSPSDEFEQLSVSFESEILSEASWKEFELLKTEEDVVAPPNVHETHNLKMNAIIQPVLESKGDSSNEDADIHSHYHSSSSSSSSNDDDWLVSTEITFREQRIMSRVGSLFVPSRSLNSEFGAKEQEYR